MLIYPFKLRVMHMDTTCPETHSGFRSFRHDIGIDVIRLSTENIVVNQVPNFGRNVQEPDGIISRDGTLTCTAMISLLDFSIKYNSSPVYMMLNLAQTSVCDAIVKIVAHAARNHPCADHLECGSRHSDL
jgi:hypothetical protein